MRVGTDSLFARVAVAGGGGGTKHNTVGDNHGGGVSGLGSYPGTQTGSSGSSSAGTFGSGAGGSSGSWSCGGGGGWYGGGYSGNDAGGGSGYVFTSDTAQYYPSGCLLNSSHYLTNAATYAGNASFPAPGGGTETGHSGNGYARITLVS